MKASVISQKRSLDYVFVRGFCEEDWQLFLCDYWLPALLLFVHRVWNSACQRKYVLFRFRSHGYMLGEKQTTAEAGPRAYEFYYFDPPWLGGVGATGWHILFCFFAQ